MPADRFGLLFDSYWTGPTGRDIQRRGCDAVILGLYLSSTRHAHMTGLYELPLLYVAADLPVLGSHGVPVLDAIMAALADLADVGFAHFDAASGFVWVVEMARIRCGLRADEPLKPHDKKRFAIAAWYAAARLNPFLGPFFDRYATQFGLTDRRGVDAAPEPPASPLQAPSEGHESPLQAASEELGSPSDIHRRTQETKTDQQTSAPVQRTYVHTGAAEPLRRGSQAPLLRGPNPRYAFDGGRVYVPQALHRKLVALRNHADADGELARWYADVADAWTNGARSHDEPGTDMFAFWQARYDEHWPATPPAPKPPRDRRPAWAR
jgi:hypothetical protein